MAKKCGATVDQKKVDLGFDYLRKSSTDTGYIGYHTHVGAYAAAGRQGLATVGHKLADDIKINRDFTSPPPWPWSIPWRIRFYRFRAKR